MVTRPNQFGSLLRELRERLGLSLRQVEASSGISNSYLSQIESGRVGAPSPKIIEKLASALQTPYLDLMRMAGHLRAAPPDREFLFLRGRSFSLSELSQEDRQQILDLVDVLLSKGRQDRRD